MSNLATVHRYVLPVQTSLQLLMTFLLPRESAIALIVWRRKQMWFEVAHTRRAITHVSFFVLLILTTSNSHPRPHQLGRRGLMWVRSSVHVLYWGWLRVGDVTTPKIEHRCIIIRKLILHSGHNIRLYLTTSFPTHLYSPHYKLWS